MIKKTFILLILLIISFSTVACSIDILNSNISSNDGKPVKMPKYTDQLTNTCTSDTDNKENPDTISPALDNTAKDQDIHVHHTNPDMALSTIIENSGSENFESINLYVDLDTRTLFFKNGDTILKEYNISAGTRTDNGDKEKEGDFRTPRGEFYICSKAKYSPPKGYLGSRWMLLSYPNEKHAERGLQQNLITKNEHEKIKKAIAKKNIPLQNTILGSAIGIHGGAKAGLPKDWTAGCIGMYDQDVEEIFEYVKKGTPVIIK